MKERFLYDDDFEQQLKEKSDQLKMYPSDKVWNEVYSNLHTRRRRFVVGMTFLIGGILLLAGKQLLLPSKNIQTSALVAKISQPPALSSSGTSHKFTANGFSATPTENTGEQSDSEDHLSPVVPYSFSSLINEKAVSFSEQKVEPVTETIKNTGTLKPIQTAELTVSVKTTAPVVVKNLADNQTATTENATTLHVADELSPEKSITQLSRIRNDRFSWELYVTPTLNTHYLNGLSYQTMAPAFQNAPIMVVHVANVNGFVDNTPVLGYNVGGNILYKISKNISLKAGLEFSFNRYYIKAYNASSGQAATELNSYLGYVADSLQNSGPGYTVNKNPQHFQNRYYQLSVPVGVDMKVAGKGKIQLHVGTTIQPSYLLNTDAYVLSSDYINYTKDPQAFRRWNVIVGGEVYLSYAVGKVRWELGPQVRYQLLSTYKNSYPLKENMLNYGIRIGISKTIR